MINSPLTKEIIDKLMEEIINIYRSDDIPWVIGYSGGKDSTAALEIVWKTFEKYKISEKEKPVHVITVDTLVESPVVSEWVRNSLNRMELEAKQQHLPIQVHILTPKVNDTFWVSLLGKGYPFPKTSFRWCTDRLKIKPTNNFIQDMIARHGEVVLVLGTRKAESSHRQQSLEKFEKMRTREHLNPSTTMSNEFIYPVLEDWSNDNVWQYLMMEKNPWGVSNKELLTMYRGATADGECPLVTSTDMPSCGNSRFGCWVCTVVDKDKSMEAMIMNDNEKAWMLPLLEFRNEIGDMSKEKERRDFRRMGGSLKSNGTELIHGPYKKEVREAWLEKLLTIQSKIRHDHTCPVENFTIITEKELEEIRRIWLYEKHQFDDSLPDIYSRTMKERLPIEGNQKKIFGKPEWDLLKKISMEKFPEEQLLFEMQTSLLDLEVHASNMRYRKGILSNLEKTILKTCYKDEEDALNFALDKEEIQNKVQSKGNEINESVLILDDGDLAQQMKMEEVIQ